jgi:hypothetical protein
MTVPERGGFTWHVNPSTRPFEKAAGKTEAYTLTCEAGGAKSERELVVERGQRIEDLALCGAQPNAGGTCTDAEKPRSNLRSSRVTRRKLRFSGRASDRACGTDGVVRSVQVAVFRKVRGGCRFVSRKGRLAKRTSCAKPTFLTAKGTTSWTLARKARLPRGRGYRVRVRVVDGAGNVRTSNRRLRVRKAG